MKIYRTIFLLLPLGTFLLWPSFAQAAHIQSCEAPVIEPRGQLFLCQGATIQLSTDEAASTFQWFKNGELIVGATSRTLDVTAAAIYKVTATYDNGSCVVTSEDREVIAVSGSENAPRLTITSESDFRFCEGGSIALTVEGNFKTILWATKPAPQNTATITVTEPGTYNVGVQMEGGCSVSGSVTVTTMSAPVIYIEASDTIVRAGESVDLMATGGSDLRWFPAEGLNDTTIANPTASPSRNMVYHVIGYSANGCSDTTAIKLYVDDRSLQVNPPKIFSPNNDGIDDLWHIQGMESYPGYSLVIFNRQGQEVFKAQPYLNNWDGNFHGKPLPEEDYYFVIRGGDKKNVKTGSILLVR